ncbi:MAG: type II secretion system secretin GspD [Halothiobacillaceae bacterium]
MRSEALRKALTAVALAAALGGGPGAWAQETQIDEEGRVTLNLRNADIEALITAVSEVTGTSFVVDPRVKARVNMISAQPMDPDRLYEVFLSILQVHGFTAVPSGEIVKVIPEVNAKGEAPVGEVGSGRRPADEVTTEVIRLRYVDAAPLLTVLRQIMPQQAALSVHQDSNALVITDRSGNIARLKDILAQVDVRDRDEIEIIRLKNASASEVQKTLQSVFRRRGGPAAAPDDAGGAASAREASFAVDKRTNSILISGDPTDRARMRVLIADLDTPLERAGNTQVFRLKYAKAEELVPILEGVRVLKGVPDLPDAEGSDAGRSSGSTSDVSIQADASLNALVVTASPEVMRELESVITQLDVRRPQVLVEAIIAEVSDDFRQRLGTQFVLGGGSGTVPIGISTFNGLLSNVVQDLASAGTDSTEAIALAAARNLGDGGNLGIGRFDGSGTDFGILVSALAANAGNNILSTPTLLTLDNEEASIVVGQNIPIVTGSFTGTESGSAITNPFQTVSREDVGVKLSLLPTISPDGTVRMNIEQEVSSLDNAVSNPAGLVTNKRNITTTVTVDDGDVVILGGLMDDSASNTRQRVPMLGDIPLVGNLFSYRESRSVKRNLMVFLRPIIIRSPDDIHDRTRNYYDNVRGAQQEAFSTHGFLSREDWPVLQAHDRYLRHVPELPDAEAGDD